MLAESHMGHANDDDRGQEREGMRNSIYLTDTL